MAENLPLVLALLALLAAAALLGAAEASLLRVRRTAVEVEAEAGARKVQRVLRLVDDLPRTLNTVLLTVLLVQIGAATVTAVLAERLFGNAGVTVASIVLTLVMFVYAEAIPKTFAVRHPLRVATATAPGVSVLAILLRPIVSALVWFADLQAPGEGIAGPGGVTEEELRRLAAEAARSGRIAQSDLALMERSFRVGDLSVEQILVPRIDVVGVPSEMAASEALGIAIESGHRRLPVYETDPDDMGGVVRLRDLAAHLSDGADDAVGTLARDVLVVPESKRVLELLGEMQASGCHFAVAVDEHGGTAGIVTIEDVVEELIGDVADEGEERQPEMLSLGDRRWRVDARLSVNELEDALEASLPVGEWNTVGGLVLAHLGHIPRAGETCDIGDLTVTVTSASRRRVREVELSPKGPAGADDPGAVTSNP